AARRPAHAPGLGPRVPAARTRRDRAPRRAAPRRRRAWCLPRRRGHGLHAQALLARPLQPDAAARAARRLRAAHAARHHHSAHQIHAGRRVSGPSVCMRLALFDLDHTLIPLDSDHAWGEFTVRLGWRDAESFRRANDGYYADYKAGTLDIRDYIRFATAAVRERGLA